MTRLRQAGCVFAEDEARILLQAAEAPGNEVRGNDALDELDVLGELVARRAAGDPLEQVVGWVEFSGLRLTVAPGVFVPRQRTTLLATQSVRAVKAARDDAAGGKATDDAATGGEVRFLEAFCGVGPVAAAVSRAIPDTQIHLGDHDETALDCARANIEPHAQTHLLTCLDGLPRELAAGLDVISAVPPYVPDSAAQFLPREALDHEASSALFGGADGLDLVRSLIRESRHWLAFGGRLLIELGVGQLHTAAEFARAVGFVLADSVIGEDEQTVVLEAQLTGERLARGGISSRRR